MAEDEQEVHELLTQQLGRVVPGAHSTILRRNNPENLTRCTLCDGSSSPQRLCVPSLVRGEVIGSVRITGNCKCTDDDRQHLESTVAQASPALGNLRTLARAENQAAIDGLTRLPNRRPVQAMAKRHPNSRALRL